MANSEGVYVCGIFAGHEIKEKKNYNDGTVSGIKHVYLIVIGANGYKITSENDYSDRIHFGDLVQFIVKLNAFNNNVYLSGDLVED